MVMFIVKTPVNRELIRSWVLNELLMAASTLFVDIYLESAEVINVSSRKTGDKRILTVNY